MSLQLSNLLPVWLIVVLVGGLLAAVAYGTWTMLHKHVRRGLVWGLTGLRLAILAVFVLILLQPVFSFTRAVPQLPEMMVLVDASQSMGQAAGKGSRFEEVMGSLNSGDLGSALRSRFGLAWYTLDRTAVPVEEDALRRLKPLGTSTQLADSLAAACNHLRALGKRPERVLLVSDGNDLGGADPVESARRFGVRIDALAPGSLPAKDADSFEIAEVQCARRVLLGSETHFRVTISGRQGATRDLAFTLHASEDGKKVLEQKVALKAGQSERVLPLSYRPGTSGLRQYEFQLQTGDGSPAGKPYKLGVQVLDSKYEVLMLEDTWRWEYKFLHRLFEDDPSFRFSALLPRGSGAFVQFASPDRRVNRVGFPQNRSDLEDFDTFFLGDVNPTRWPRSLASALAGLVEEGKSLVVIAGPNLANLLEVQELHALLPVELTRESGTPVEGPIDVRLRPDSTSSPFFFQLRADAAEKLPPLDHVYPALRKRPGATVLLESEKHRNAYGNLIVLAEHTIGRGRVLFVGTDTLWKWQTLAPAKEAATPYSIFWQQAFRAMTPIRSNVGPVNLWLTPDRTRTETGRSVGVRAEVQSPRGLPPPVLQAAVILPDERRLPLVFSASPTAPGTYHAEFVPRMPGAYRIAGTLASEGKTVTDAMTALQVEEARGETSDQGIDLANLTRIAAATGGQLVDPSRPETWPTTGEGPPPTVQQFRTFDLWNNFTLMLLLCGLLGVDWFIRLFKGLV